MIVVDTNVWSESLRPDPDPTVLTWMREHHRELFMPVVARHELRVGVLLLPDGRRREALALALDHMLGRMSERLLPYDMAAADAHATIRARAQAGGRPLTSEDGQILGIAAALGAPIATRNLRDFVDRGGIVIDPWSPSTRTGAEE